MSQKKKICIFAENAYPLISGKSAYFGGAEVQITLLAKELAKRSYDVSVITFGKTSKFHDLWAGVKVYNPFDNRLGGYTYILPHHIYKLTKILNKINADIYIKKGVSPLTGLVAFLARLQKKKFFFIASSNKDMDTFVNKTTFFNIPFIFFRFGIKNCSMVICQTKDQQHLLQQNIGKKGVVINNLYIPPEIEDVNRYLHSLKILWVGRLLENEKRPELFFDLAKQMLDYRFRMIVISYKSDPKYYNDLKKIAKTIDNLEFLENVPYKEMNKYYREASMLVSTSLFEGYPNTFLEAWGNSIPVVSIGVDPDEIICRNKLGVHVENYTDLVKNINILLKNDSLRKEMGMQGRKYVEKYHNIDRIVDEYEKLFNEIPFV
jgi:glycosyltransferase involved in cell wall biosynthesis